MSKPEMTLKDFVAAHETLVRIAAIHKELAEKNATYVDAKAAIEKRLKAEQAACKHWFTTYYADASGGNDSMTVCDLCRAEI